MRLILRTRRLVVDLEVARPEPEGERPAPPALTATSGGDFERAQQYGDPATQVGFGFRA